MIATISPLLAMLTLVPTELAAQLSAALAEAHAAPESSIAADLDGQPDHASGPEDAYGEDALLAADTVPFFYAQTDLDAAMPKDWMEPVRRCHQGSGRRFCDGPRRIALPHGDEAALAEALGLGSTQAASLALTGRIPDEWLEAAAGKPVDELLWPVEEAYLGRGFGYVRRAALRHVRHDGVDIPAPVGTPVHATNDGLVVYADNGVRGFGNLLLVLHADGSTTLFAHLSAGYVFAGQHVRRGQVIGAIGTTGLSQGPHLHFEWRPHGRPQNPVAHFTKRPLRARHRNAAALAKDEPAAPGRNDDCDREAARNAHQRCGDDRQR